CFDAAWLRANVGNVPASASGEYYLTDLVALATAGGRRVAVVSAPRPELTTGINDRVALAEAERLLRAEIAERHMRNGVTIVDPANTFIDAAVEIGQDVRIEPWTVLSGTTAIAQDAVIGPNATVRDSRIGRGPACGPASSSPRRSPRTWRSGRTATFDPAAASVHAAASATSRS
ncbi:MAG TPA: hypothetical protein VHK28_05305, partial [Candidatus Limnocylindria bacterium]|nr:hypothetical protein [Candidatus Limnocylindria bacterium]